ncbi:MAG: hypothetical protein LBR07_08955 [Puniceicoccales bacterium]|nr:hypothetical protein [Puniceicoccales bacterium]
MAVSSVAATTGAAARTAGAVVSHGATSPVAGNALPVAAVAEAEAVTEVATQALPVAGTGTVSGAGGAKLGARMATSDGTVRSGAPATVATCESIAVMTAVNANSKVFAVGDLFKRGVVTSCVSYINIPDDAVGFPDGVDFVQVSSPTTPSLGTGYYYHCIVVFTTTQPNTVVHLNAGCGTPAPYPPDGAQRDVSAVPNSSTTAVSDNKLLIGSLDTFAATDPDHVEVTVGEEAEFDVLVPSPGNHFIEVIYDYEDDTTGDGDNLPPGVWTLLKSADGCSFALWNCLNCDVSMATPPFTGDLSPDCGWLFATGKLPKTCTPLCECPCNCKDSNAAEESVNCCTGGANVSSPGLNTSSFGTQVSQTLNYSNLLNVDALEANGISDPSLSVNWIPRSVARMFFLGESRICVLRGTNATLWFHKVQDEWLPRYGAPYSLKEKPDEGKFVLFNKVTGVTQKFNDRTVLPLENRGLLVSETDAGKVTTTTYAYTSVLSSTAISSITITKGTLTDTFVYSYGAFGLSSVYYYGQKGTRRVEYTYCTSDGDYGRVGDLQTVVVKDGTGPSAPAITRTYYRYYGVNDASVFPHALRYVVGPAAWDRMSANGLDPTTATNAQIGQYADRAYGYDDECRVTFACLAAGTRNYSLNYERSIFWKEFNGWSLKTTVHCPDGSVEVIYSNGFSQPMLRLIKESAASDAQVISRKGFIYNSVGKLITTVSSSAIGEINEEWPWLFSTNASDGFVQNEFFNASGAAVDFPHARAVSNGISANTNSGENPAAAAANDTQTLLEEFGYIPFTLDEETRVLLGTKTVFRSEAAGGSAPAQESYLYTLHADTLQILQRTRTLPAVSETENGDGIAAQRTEIFDTTGRVVWLRDERGVITFFAYDDETSAVLQRIDDVDTSQVADPPVGWTTAAGFGLHLTTDFECDGKGRTTLELGPAHMVDIDGVATVVRTANYTVYKDVEHEVWSASGYATGSVENYVFTTLAPVTISRTDAEDKPLDGITACYTGSGRLSPTDSFPQSTWLSWTHYEYNNAQQLTEERVYFSIPVSGTGTEGVNYNKTTYGYDNMGRQNRVRSPGGSITKKVFDVRGFHAQTWEGTDDSGGGDMVQTEEFEYDNGNYDGDGLLTKATRFESTAGGVVREIETSFAYDWRRRKIAEKNPLGVTQRFALDNLDRVVTRETRGPDTDATLLAWTDICFDVRGHVFRNLIYSITGGNLANAIATDTWFDPAGNIIKQRSAGSRIFTKTTFNGLNLPVKIYTCEPADGLDDGPTNDVTGALVVEQVFRDYDEATNIVGAHRYLRFHDASSTATGELNGPGGASPRARVYHAFFYPNAVGQVIATANYGTNGGTVPSRPDTIPSQSDNVLVSLQSYDSAGNVFETTDPDGKVKHYEYDAQKRVVKQVENYTGGAPGTDTDKTTLFTYAPDGGIATLTLKNSVTGDQVTTWQYGTTLAGSGIATSHLLSLKILPDDDVAGGAPDRVSYTYTRQKLAQTMTDQNGNTHAYQYDENLRLAADVVTVLGAGVNGSVRRIETTHDLLDRVTGVVSFDAATGGNVVNAVAQGYNAFGQLVTDVQAHTGPVVSGTPAANYDYVNGTNNCIAAIGINYPNYRQVDNVFNRFLDEVLGRAGSIHDSVTGGVIANYDYIGSDNVVRAYYNEPNIMLTYQKQTGEENGDAGDQYNGLDRFGRIADQRWATWTLPVNDLDRYKYTYNRASIRLSRRNLVSAAQTPPVFLDELYANDGLQQITNRKLGQLDADNSTILGIPTQEEGWQFDPAGNWLVYTQNNEGVTTIAQTRTHNVVNEILTIDGSAAKVSFDPAGNMTTVPSDVAAVAVPFTTEWDAWQRLVRIQGGPNNIDIRYEYDGFFRRTRQLVTAGSAPSLDFFYNKDWKIIEERIIDFDPSAAIRSPVTNKVRAQYIYGVRDRNDLILRDFSPDCIEDDTRHYVTSDAMFSTTAIILSSGTVVQRFNYSAFGIPTLVDSNFSNAMLNSSNWAILFHGEEYDSDVKLSNYGIRASSPLIGRWTSSLKIKYESASNLFSEFSNVPIVFTDKLGCGAVKVFHHTFLPEPDLFQGTTLRPTKGISSPSFGSNEQNVLLGLSDFLPVTDINLSCECPTDDIDVIYARILDILNRFPRYYPRFPYEQYPVDIPNTGDSPSCNLIDYSSAIRFPSRNYSFTLLGLKFSVGDCHDPIVTPPLAPPLPPSPRNPSNEERLGDFLYIRISDDFYIGPGGKVPPNSPLPLFEKIKIQFGCKITF